MKLGQAMKQRRAELRRTASECASLAGMTSSEWSRWEAGQSRRKDGKPSEPRTETLRAIAYALDFSQKELREQAGMEDGHAQDIPSEWARIWIDTPAKERHRLLKATKGVQEALTV